MMISKLRKSRGFTLVELMIVVAIIGVLAALAIYGVRKYISNAKTAEARAGIGRMAKDASSAYNKEGMSPSVLKLGDGTGVNNKLCVSSKAPVPATIAGVKGEKYQSRPSDWQDGAGWSCLGFSMSDPQYYMYSYTGPEAGEAQATKGSKFVAKAQGDLDGDGTPSEFTIEGEIQEDSNSAGALVLTVAPNLNETNPDE